MNSIGPLLLVLFCAATIEANIEVISTLCQTGAAKKWLKCPDQANVKASSSAEFLDNIQSKDEDQKFCCGDPMNRFCCSFQEKLKEIPGFDPKHHFDDGVRYRFHRPSFWGFWSYTLMFFLTAFTIGVIFWIFGFVLFEIIYMVFCCFCCCRKKKSTKDYQDPVKTPAATTSRSSASSRSNPYPDNRLVAATPSNPPNYQAISTASQPYNFGGTADLYRDVSNLELSSSTPPPPSYQQTSTNGNIPKLHV